MKRFIDVNKLIINPENYRFDPVLTQTEAIDLMLERKGQEILNLASHIAERGLDQARDVRVVKKNKSYLVLDGNRRITAIRCLYSPRIVKNRRLKDAFQNLSRRFTGTIPKRINCFVYPNEEASSEWIRLDHTGKNEGLGQDPWGAPETERFNQRFGGRSSLGIQAFDLLSEKGVRLDSKSLKLSTINRLLSDPLVREYLGVQQTKGILELVAREGDVLSRLQTLFKEVIDHDLKVREVYLDKDREGLVKKLFKKPLQRITKTVAAAASISRKGSTRLATRSISPKRKTLIPRSCSLRIKNSRLNKIYFELKQINIDIYENAVAVLFRVFLEGSLDVYLKYKKINLRKNPQYDVRLTEKLRAVANNLKLPPDEQKVINKAIASKDSIYSIDTFNSYIHNTKLHPDPRDLKRSWDEFQPFFERLWAIVR